MTAGDIYRCLDSRAPFDTAESWDNPGLLIGSPTEPVSRVLVALDATPGAIAAAAAAGAQLILTHHPVIFPSLTRLEGNSPAYRLAATGIGVISAHTNLDKAADGVNDTLAALLGLIEVRPAPDGMSRIGRLPIPMAGHAFARAVGQALHTAVRVNGDGAVSTVAVCGGSGGDMIPALAGAADAFVTGEVKHHQWLTAAAAGLTVIEAGHHATEQPVVATLCQWLEEALPTLEVIPYLEDAPYTTL